MFLNQYFYLSELFLPKDFVVWRPRGKLECGLAQLYLLLKQMHKKQTGFVLLLKQNKSDLVFHHENQNKSNGFSIS